MATAAEGAAAKQGIAANLAIGVETLSGNDAVTFTRYNRLVLPLDGYVFWVRADLLTPSALLNVMGMNTSRFNQPQAVAAAAPTLSAQGSFHYATNQRQDEDETVGVSLATFTSLVPVQEFNNVQPDTLWIGEYAGDAESFDGPVTFAFSSRGRYYKEADLFHYVGTAVLPAFRSQLIDSVAVLAQRQLIVSNSLPIWLSLNGYAPPYPDGFRSSAPLYPSFLVPDNLIPPYVVIHVDPARTEALQSAPWFSLTLSQEQLAADHVRATLYGLTNEAALTFVATVEQFCYDYGLMGLMNMPVPRDEKRAQVELGVLAMKKVIDFDVSYNQSAARNVARQYIEKCVIGYTPTFPPVP